MKKIIYFFLITFALSCNSKKHNQEISGNVKLATTLENYYNESMKLFPVDATYNGDTTYNDLLPATFTDSYFDQLTLFYKKYKQSLSKFDTVSLNDNDQKSLEILNYELDMYLRGLELNLIWRSFNNENRYIPFDQFNGIPLEFGQMGSGKGIQPFKTVKDYDNWLKRATAFSAWSDSAIVAFKKGIAVNYMLLKAVVIKMIPQLLGLTSEDVTKSIFYGPVNRFPSSFSEVDKKRLTMSFVEVINEQIVPAYNKLAVFLQTEYLPKARTTTGINSLKGGDELYTYLVKYWTTTNKTPDEIYKTGLSEVKRIREEMELVKNQVGFKSSLDSFFTFMKTDKQFMPYKTADEVLTAFRNIQTTIDPNLKKMFTLVPKTKFEIRQTESFRAATASAEYWSGLPDGSRPGIFYVPIIDATTFNTTSGMESLFLHEAIPGHHYQLSLQSENLALPSFRRYIWYGAYGEGYALYCESLGKELGLYTDPYQYMGALGEEIHRAIRLVVDVAMHTGKMTREEAIQYMMENESISEQGAVAEIERYMVYPGQALCYKIGALKIRELRNKYSQQLGNKFNLASFHDEYLKNGCMPLDLLEHSMDVWADIQ